MHAHGPPDACASDIAVNCTQHAPLFRMDSVIGTYAAHGPPPDRARRGTLCRRPTAPPLRPADQNGRCRPPFHPHRRKQRQTRRGRLRPRPPSPRRHRRRAQRPQLRPSSVVGRVAHDRRADPAPIPTRRRPRRPPHRDRSQEKETLLRLLQPGTRLWSIHKLGPMRQMVRGDVGKFQPWLFSIRRSVRGRRARCWPRWPLPHHRSGCAACARRVAHVHHRCHRGRPTRPCPLLCC